MSAFFMPEVASRHEKFWTPGVDIYHSRMGWLIKLDLAGVQLSDVSIEAKGTRLIVSGCRRDLMVNEEWNHYSMEIAYNRFERAIELPCNLDRTGVSAELRDGMLLIYVMLEGDGL